MANNKIQVKRTNVSGRTANVTNSGNAQYIDAGELALNMADGILYTSNGSALIEVGANNTSQRITNALILNNDKRLNFNTVNTNVSAYFIQQNDDNFVFYTTNTAYGARPVWSIYANSDSSAFNFGVPVTFTGANVNFGSTRIFANGSSGTAGQVLTSNGTATYWSTVTGGGGGTVNTAAQFTWTNTHIFQANVSFTGNGIGISSNTGAIYLGGISDANWKIARNSGALTKWVYTNNTIDIVTANSNLEGMAIGLVNSNTYFETGYLGTFVASNLTIGNTSSNATINSTAFSGSANSSTYANGSITNTFTVGSGTYFVSNGDVGIGNSTPNAKLTVTGTANISSSLVVGGTIAYQDLNGTTITGQGIAIATGYLGWRNGVGTSVDTTFFRDGSSGIIGQRNGTNPQTSRIYGTYTDASNYERLSLSANATAAYIQAQEAGTGTARDLYIGANNTTHMVVAANGNIGIGNTTPTNPLVINAGSVTNRAALTVTNVGAGTGGMVLGAMQLGNQQDWGRLTAIYVANKSLAYTHAGTANSGQGVHRFGGDNNSGTSSGANGSIVDILAPSTATNIFQGRKADETVVLNLSYNGNLYVANNIGIGNNAPSHKLRVQGDVSLSGGVHANGGFGISGQVLTSNGTVAYWSTPTTGTVTSVDSGNGLTGGPITSTGTLSVLANTGIVANATGVFVNATYIGTISANNASFLGGTAAAAYVQNTDSRVLSGNLAFTGANLFFSSPTLGGTATNFVNNFTISTNVGNASFLRFYHYRHTTGADWTGVSTRIQQRIDVTDQGYLEYNPSGYTFGMGLFGSSGVGLTVSQTGQSIFGNTVFLGSVGLSANGGLGTAGHVLHSNGTATYWAADDNSGGTVTSVATGNGITGGTITTTGTVSVLANTGIVANATGTFVNATYIGTISSNNASFLGGVAAANYVRKDQNNDIVENIRIRFGSANQTDVNDGTIAAGLFANGLNIVGTQTQAGTGRQISYFGTLIDRASAGATFAGTVTLAGVSANGGLGTAGQVLTTNGTATYWATAASGGSANSTGGTGSIQFYNGTTFGSSANLLFDGTRIAIGNSTVNSTANLTNFAAHVHISNRPSLGFNYTIPNTHNSIIAGPYTVNTGIILTVETGARLVIV